MCPRIRQAACAIGIFSLANAWGLDSPGTAKAQEDSGLVRSARGGALVTVGPHQFEVFFYATGLRVFPWGAEGAALDASRLTGTATFYHPNSPEPWFVRPLHPAAADPGQASGSLDLAIDLSTVPPTGARVTFEIAGLPERAKSVARFTVPFEFVKTPAEFNGGRPVTAEAHGYAPIASTAYYFPLAGFYSTPVGFVWVPAPGYYHVGPSTQYYRPGSYRPPAGWERAHPAPAPTPSVAQSLRPDLSEIQTDYYWHPRAMDDQASHEAWIRRQLSEKYGPGRGP